MREEPVTALYLRVSDEDKDVRGGGESESITGQRLLLKEFVQNHKELSSGRLIELVDEGWSGTHFERPAVRKLLEMARARQLDCVVVKDFSRFGRNYLEVGHYLEQIFPFLGIRFVSVNDHFDSFDGIGAAGDISVGFKNFIHQAYSKDLSGKIKSAQRVKAAQGEFLTAFAPYGYRKAENNKNQLIEDGEWASVVRRVFRLYLDGMGKTAIARLLNKEQIPSPLMARKQRGEHFRHTARNEKSHWTASTVSQILSDQRYTGDGVYGKTKVKEPGTKKSVPVPREDWIIVPASHPAIVERAVFEAAQAGKRRHHYRRGQERPLSKTVLCHGCNHAMIRTEKEGKGQLRCVTHRHTHQYTCFSGSLPESQLEEAVLICLRLLALLGRMENTKPGSGGQTPSAILQKKRKIAKKQIEKEKNQVLALYERFRAGGLTKEEFTARRARLESGLVTLQEQLRGREEICERATRGGKGPGREPGILFPSLTREAVRGFVDIIYTKAHGELFVIWRFSDPFFPEAGNKKQKILSLS